MVTGEVKTRKKPLGERMKDVFLGGDAQTVARYVGAEVLLPALRNLLVDATTKGIERMVYGESASPRRVPDYRPRTTYNSPINRGYTRILGMVDEQICRISRHIPQIDQAMN